MDLKDLSRPQMNKASRTARSGKKQQNCGDRAKACYSFSEAKFIENQLTLQPFLFSAVITKAASKLHLQTPQIVGFHCLAGTLGFSKQLCTSRFAMQWRIAEQR